MWAFRKTRAAPVRKAAKKAAAEAALDRLNRFLDEENPRIVRMLTGLWKDQEQAITYKELREAILYGGMSEDTLRAWQEDYARLVNTRLQAEWAAAARAGAVPIEARAAGFFYDHGSPHVRGWLGGHAAEFVTQAGREQREAMAALISRGAGGAFGADELSRAIRPLIGLTKPQALANLRYYQNVRDHFIKENPTMKFQTAEKRAREAAVRYAERQHRQRAYTIATTELAYGYNRGADEAVCQAMEQGYMGRTVRVWSTAADEGVCPVCGALDGTPIDMAESFATKGASFYGGQGQLPPAHPRCRCAVYYEEVEPPAWKSGQGQGDLYREPARDIIGEGMAAGRTGDTDGYTTISQTREINFSDPDAVAKELSSFAARYAGAREEHALVLSPLGTAFSLDGAAGAVNTRLVGLDALVGGIVIHNHPVVDGFVDAFSREDFRELFWGRVAESWLVAGNHIYRMSYTGPPVTPAEAVERYKAAFARVRVVAMQTGMMIEHEQLEIMRELARTMEGVRFDEFSV